MHMVWCVLQVVHDVIGPSQERNFGHYSLLLLSLQLAGQCPKLA